MSLAQSARIARRELRGGLRGFKVFLACLALGVAAIAAVGLVRESLSGGLMREGATMLGGDAELRFTYRAAGEAEQSWMAAQATRVSEIVDFRSMARAGENTALTQVKGVDDIYPLYGEVRLEPAMPLDEALAGANGLPGAVMDPSLMAQLELEVGDTFQLGTASYHLAAALTLEPDAAGSGFSLGPRTLLYRADLEGSGLLAPGTLFETNYRLALPQGTDLAALRDEALAQFSDAGVRWRDSRNGAPGLNRFVDRISAFLVLVGLAGLAVGGVGVSAAVRAYLERKTPVIATLKTLGATRRTILWAYLIQIGALSALGIAIGLALGALAVLLLAPVLEARLPLPTEFTVYPGPLAEAALYGALTALIFTLWPVSRAEEIRPAQLFRAMSDTRRRLPRWTVMLLTAGLAALLVGAAAWFSGLWELTLWAALGVCFALLLLLAAAWAIRRLARRLARAGFVRGIPALRLALGSVGGPGQEASAVVLSLGLGLSVLAAVGQVSSNMRAAIQGDLPDVAPSFFFIDIQPDQIVPFLARLDGDPAVTRVDTAPMLRGVVTRINGTPATEIAPDHWVVRGDRGLTYAAAQPDRVSVVEGAWWPEDYTGPPLMSFAAEEAAEIGLKLGDEITVNVLGREITATIASFREVDFSTMGINFVMTFNAAALQGAPHSHIATVYAEAEAEPAILRDVSQTWPNITGIGVREAISRVAGLIEGIAAAITYGALASLVTGGVVLIGAAAAGQPAREFEAAVLKTLGAVRRRVLAYLVLRAALLGLAAGVVAIVAGGLAGWAVTTFVMEGTYTFEPVSALAIVTGGVLATLLAGLGFALRPLAMPPARVLRSAE
ncbi:ABC transporter permease [Oceanicola sp. 502str15]|uniref:ABC transporter permease n=1 Tax=Oceanicola sp. 502str15 TaxID=2696061 RepID=UPI00209651E6|nr:FtsX-like permease family protein [Oceanicola sp. 502str15]MCO6384534.1 FtsX-like permease family protein [Oceanicola sp. 502str15]